MKRRSKSDDGADADTATATATAATTTTTTEPVGQQLSFIPDEPLSWTYKPAVSVGDFPPNEQLIGPDPGKEMIQQTQQYGAIIEPLIARENTDRRVKAKYAIIRGRRRIKAARACGVATVPVRILSGDVSWKIAAGLDLNAHTARKDNPAAEYVQIKKLLASEKNLTEKDLAAVIGMPLAVVTKRLALENLVPELFDAMMRGRIASGVADQCAALTKRPQNKLAKVFKANGRLTMADVREVKKARREEGTAALDFAALKTPGAGDTGTADAAETTTSAASGPAREQVVASLAELYAAMRWVLKEGAPDLTIPRKLVGLHGGSDAMGRARRILEAAGALPEGDEAEAERAAK